MPHGMSRMVVARPYRITFSISSDHPVDAALLHVRWILLCCGLHSGIRELCAFDESFECISTR